MRLISFTKASLTHTETGQRRSSNKNPHLTLFADEGVVAVVGVVRIACGCTTAISYNAEVELCRYISINSAKSILHLLTQEFMTEAA
jgi:hypothetical protein